jgi:catalase
VFVRFSTVGGSRGSADTVRDVRGFAVKFYTDEGNFDLVGNNRPVFFIQDGIKFPDIVHAVKPEPHHEMPQASSAHDSFWDFVSLVPETAHMVMWLMSDRAIPRSYRMMEGFGVHTFRLVDERGGSSLVKFHWKPLLGMSALVWDEAQKLAGKDPDFHRRDLWEAIESGAFPEYELGIQVMKEEDALAHGFDLLDPTKLVPEELVPVRPIGKLTLDRNPDNFFAETEQVAFCVANLVSGIDVTNDPLMQARLFSYQDTQLTRLGGPNFAEIPINRPIAPVHNHQQDGFGRQTILASRANYHPNSISGGCPFLASAKEGFTSFPEPLHGTKARARSETFEDHFSQATMFLESLTSVEREHLVNACRFEVGKVESLGIRERVVNQIFARIDPALAAAVAEHVGVTLAKKRLPTPDVRPSPALSMERTKKRSIATRKVAVLVAPGVSGQDVAAVRAALEAGGAIAHLVGPFLGPIATDTKGGTVDADKSLLIAPSVMFDAVYVPGGKSSVAALRASGEALAFVEEAYRHYKTIGATGEGAGLVAAALSHGDPAPKSEDGVVIGKAGADPRAFAKAFVAALAEDRHWARKGFPR